MAPTKKIVVILCFSYKNMKMDDWTDSTNFISLLHFKQIVWRLNGIYVKIIQRVCLTVECVMDRMTVQYTKMMKETVQAAMFRIMKKPFVPKTNSLAVLMDFA